MSDTNIKSAESYRIDIPVAENIKATPITTAILDMLEEQKEILKEIRDALTNITRHKNTEIHGNSKDCLMCSNSFSADDENGNQILRCVEHEGKIVDPESPVCADFN